MVERTDGRTTERTEGGTAGRTDDRKTGRMDGRTDDRKTGRMDGHKGGRKDGVCIEVVDTGIGIASSKLDTIFEPFLQADSSVTRIYGGTGLGLALTRRVAGLMGGVVEVESTPGLGSLFRLRLPLPAAALPIAATPSAALLPAPSPAPHTPAVVLRRVLLAEDNDVNVYLFQAMLADQPLAITVAPNGPTALDLLRRQPYDLAFIDVQMPGMDGLSVTRALRALEAQGGRPRTPVVALTANAFASDVDASLDAGCDRHLAKPFAKAQLLQAVAELAGAPGGAGPATTTDAGHAPASAPVLDEAAAVQRLGGDVQLFRRLVAHAAVFVTGWQQAYSHALNEGDTDQARRLAHDLKAVAGTLCAGALAARAAELENSLAEGAAAGPALAALHAALGPVMVVLSRPPPSEA